MSDNEMWEAMQDEELPEKFDEAPDRFVERLDSDATLEEKRSAFDRLMDRAISKGPNKKVAKEFLAADDAEYEEADATETGTLIGTMSSGTTAATAVTHAAYPPYTTSTHGHSTVMPGGGMVGGGHVWAPTPTTPSWGTVPPAPVTPTPAAKPGKAKGVEQVPLPSKFTPKVLLAFLEENEGMEDGLVWAAHLLAEHFEMRLEDGEIRLVMEFSLRDHYGNNPSKD